MSNKNGKVLGVILSVIGLGISFLGGMIKDNVAENKQSIQTEKYLDKKFDEYIKNKK